MKFNDSGDFCVLYVEPADERTTLIQALSGQKKPVVLLLAEQSRLFHGPEDFNDLKHVKRQLDVPILFVIPHSEQLIHQANRQGFPAYNSMEALSDALLVGSALRPRQPTVPLSSAEPTRRSRPLASTGPVSTTPVAPVIPVAVTAKTEVSYRRTVPLEQRLPGDELPRQRTMPLAPGMPPVEEVHEIPRRRSMPVEEVHEIPHRRTAPLERTKPAPVPPPTEPVIPRHPASARARRKESGQRSLLALAILMLIALVVAGLGSFMVFFRGTILQAPAASGPKIVGHVSFLSSEQVSENSSQGIDDKVLVDLTNVPPPAAHKSYYAWLLGDHTQSDMLSVPLGMLKFSNGHATVLYPGDVSHTNLLLMTSRFLVTEEDSMMTPVAPSPDQATWRYYGEFSQTRIASAENVKQYSFLDHLRHLLAADPTLDAMELPGGLNTWLYNNTGKLQEWTTSMREPWVDSKDVGFVRRQSIRVLDYLDGVAFVSQDLAPGTPVLVDGRLGSVGLLQIAGPAQDPPSYTAHIVQHLNGLLQAGQFSPQLRAQATAIVSGLDNVQHWLGQVRSDASQIVRMTDAQLRQPATLNLINDMIANVNNAYVGQADPLTGQMHEGVAWIHDHMQSLASLNVTPYRASSSSLQLIQDLHHLRVLVPAATPTQGVH